VVLGHVPTPRMGAAARRRRAETLAQLTRLVDSGRIYDRDLGPIAAAAVVLNQSLGRRLERSPRRYR